MIDTIDVFYKFGSYENYDACYAAVDDLSRKSGGQALHKDGRKYLTTAFSKFGVLQISFSRIKYHCSCNLLLQPIRFISPGSHLLLCTVNDYPEIIQRLNSFLDLINQAAGYKILPHIEWWHVRRIDYAVDIETPYVDEYLNLFKAGNIPAGFNEPKPYASSFYLTSKNVNINFYNKLLQVKEKYDMSEEDIIQELGHLPRGLLRLESQCNNRHIHHIKKHLGLPKTSLPLLANPSIAEKELKNRVESIVGREYFIPFSMAEDILSEHYSRRTLSRLCQIMRILKDSPEANLDIAQVAVSPNNKNEFAQLVHKIREFGFNPIPLEVAYRDPCVKQSLSNLPNLYDMIFCAE